MKNLVNQVKGTNDVFDATEGIDDSVIKEYELRNERKKDDGKWLKKHKPSILKAMESLGTTKKDFDDVRVSYSVPDKSFFDMDKVMAFLEDNSLVELATKRVVDEKKLEKLIEDGVIDIEKLQERAWVEKEGTPRLIVKKVKKNS